MLGRASDENLPVAELARSFEPDVQGPKVCATSATAGNSFSADRLSRGDVVLVLFPDSKNTSLLTIRFPQQKVSNAGQFFAEKKREQEFYFHRVLTGNHLCCELKIRDQNSVVVV